MQLMQKKIYETKVVLDSVIALENLQDLLNTLKINSLYPCFITFLLYVSFSVTSHKI